MLPKCNSIILSVSSVFALSTLSFSAAINAQSDEDVGKKADSNVSVEHIQIIGRDNKLNTESGSATLIDELTLEKFDYDDIHRVLASVPGVNIRQEDGYGLRPNIGFRGVTPERSKKINILEDGVLIGPAPYSAPAAYYFPSVNRMTSVEVFKGPAAVKYGPNTVAGTLNMTTRTVPSDSEGHVEISLGSNGYQKLHGFYGNSFTLNNTDNIGFVIETLTTHADGFKDIDNAEHSLYDSDSGFDKTDFMLKTNYLTNGHVFGIEGQHLFELKLGKADESSNETYLGLTDSDFDATPYRRYAASQVGNMDWQQKQIQFTHHFTSASVHLTNRIYRNEFERAWRKVNGFNSTGNPATDRTLQEVLTAPEEDINSTYYQILTGQQDSDSSFQQIIVGTNDRSYYSQGIQSDLTLNINLFELEHVISSGIRFHQDKINRDHFEQNYLMQSGVMTPDNFGTYFTTVNEESTDAISIYFEDTIKLDNVEITAGSRAEIIGSHYQNLTEGKENDWLKKQSITWLYSLSAFYIVNQELGLFAGVHQGYVPTSPKQAAQIQPEESINYELGARFNNGVTKLESVLFFNDFNNLKESCSFSTSASCSDDGSVDQEYNGGEVDVYGLELSLSSTEQFNESLDIPWSLTFTQTESEFKHDLNSTFELWGDVNAGDAVPYLPEQQLTASLGLAANNWEVNLLVKYTSEMLETAGENATLSGLKTEAYTVIDLSVNYELGNLGRIYLKVDNITDTVALVSRRPYGARPSKPQQIFLGYKYNF